MNNKKIILFLFPVLIILLSFFAKADTNFTLTNSYKWLNTTMYDKNWEGPIDEISLSILALSTGGYDVKQGIAKLKDKMNPNDGSWNGNIYDTSLATYALFKTKNDVNLSVEWLLQQQVQSTTYGNWYIQIKTINTDPRPCNLYLDGSPDGVQFDVNNIGVSNCNANSGNTWIDLQECAQFQIGINNTLLVNCNNVGNSDISLIFKRDNNYYLLDGKSSVSQANFKIDNAYFGEPYDNTAYATWVLTELGKSGLVHTLPYLKSNARDDSSANIDRALLLLVSSSNVYVQYLKGTQDNLTGYWDDGNIYNSAFIIYALKKQSGNSVPNSISQGLAWLQGAQVNTEGRPDLGSWDDDAKTTAMAIYAIKGDIVIKPTNITNKTVSTCGNFIIDNGEQCDAKYDADFNLLNGNDTLCAASKICSNVTCKCINKQTGCTSANDCPTPSIYTCVNSKCQIKSNYCDDNNPCLEGKICNTKTNLCDVIKPSTICTSDEQCVSEKGEGYECKEDSCQWIEGYCDKDNPCDKGYSCNKNNRCEKSSFPWWIITLIILLVAGGLVFFFMKKKGGIKIKSNNQYKPSSQNQQSPFARPSNPMAPMQPRPMQPRPIQPPPRNYMDDQLEKDLDNSIKKAKDLMGKK
jgi:hypothetical protein